MKWCLFGVFISFLCLSTSQQIEVRRNDGSYSIGLSSNSLGSTADSVAALLSKASGWTGTTGIEGRENVNIQVSNTIIQTAKQVPYIEILKLVETFLKFKGEVAGRTWALASDNALMIAALRDTLISKLSTIHNLTLNSLSVLVLTLSQQVPTKSLYWRGSNEIEGRQGVVSNIQIPNYIATGVQIAKQVPYVEILKLVESFLRLKGEVSGRAWALVYDNAHIIAALRDTLISKISTVHNLTLNAVIILRKVLEFASTLFSNVQVNVGSTGPIFDKTFSFGR